GRVGQYPNRLRARLFGSQDRGLPVPRPPSHVRLVAHHARAKLERGAGAPRTPGVQHDLALCSPEPGPAAGRRRLVGGARFEVSANHAERHDAQGEREYGLYDAQTLVGESEATNSYLAPDLEPRAVAMDHACPRRSDCPTTRPPTVKLELRQRPPDQLRR